MKDECNMPQSECIKEFKKKKSQFTLICIIEKDTNGNEDTLKRH